MLTLAPNLRIWLCTRPTDLRKSFDGLCAVVRGVFQADPLDGSLFLFVNRRGDRLKALWWDRDGLALFYKRLESGTFEVPSCEGESSSIQIDATELARYQELYDLEQRGRFLSVGQREELRSLEARVRYGSGCGSCSTASRARSCCRRRSSPRRSRTYGTSGTRFRCTWATGGCRSTTMRPSS